MRTHKRRVAGRRAAEMKIKPVIFLLTFILCSCVDNPYISRAAKDDPGATHGIVFAYGKFCGASHPNLVEITDQGSVPTDLMSLWPPVDDIDVMCFAHDYCYQKYPYADALCDYSFTKILADFNEEFVVPGCFNLAHDIASGFYIAPKRTFPPPSYLQRVVGASTSRMLRQMRSTTDEYPMEGDCKLTSQDSISMVFDAFEKYFNRSKPSYIEQALNIPREFPE